jgi:hypothetical protein
MHHSRPDGRLLAPTEVVAQAATRAWARPTFGRWIDDIIPLLSADRRGAARLDIVQKKQDAELEIAGRRAAARSRDGVPQGRHARHRGRLCELDPSCLLTHRMSLEEAPRGYAMVKDKEDGLRARGVRTGGQMRTSWRAA